MPKPDPFGQSVQIATRTDAADAAKLADDLATGLVPRSNMRFATAAERNATITSPVRGMVAYLYAEDLFTGYSAGGWVVLAAGTQAWTTVSLATGFTHDGNSNGTFQYRIVNLFGEPTVMLRGGLGVTYSGSPSVIRNGGIVTSAPLPVSARPSTLRTTVAACSTSSSDVLSVKIDAPTTGHIHIVGTTNATAAPKIQPPWVSFNGLYYSL